MTIPDTNLFLYGLSSSAHTLLLKHASVGDLPLHTLLHPETSKPRYAYFLLSGLASVVTTMPSGESAEVGFVGVEGVVGTLHLLGNAFLSTRCTMQLFGNAVRIPFADLQQAFDQSYEVRSRILEFVQEQSAVTAQIAGCNRLHSAEQRLIRWLLMAQDRTGYQKLEFTQDYLSQMIATQRTTVTIIAGGLQDRGLISYSRGTIHILDRPGLEAATCVCYSYIKTIFSALYRQDGAAAGASDGPGSREIPMSA